MATIASLSPQAWWRADAITGLADGATIASWPDSSGNSHDGVAGNGPTIRHGQTPNGGQVVNLALGQFFSTEAEGATPAQTVAAVFRVPDTSGYRALLGASYGGALELRVESGTNQIYAIRGHEAAIALSNGSATVGEWTLLVFTIQAGSSYAFRLNRADDLSGATSVSFAPPSNQTVRYIGREQNDLFVGDIAEMVTWDRVLTGAEILDVEAEIAARWLEGAPAGPTGTIDGTLPALTGEILGSAVTVGTIDGTLPAFTGSIAGDVEGPISGEIDGTLPALTGEITGDVTAPISGTIGGALPALEGSITDGGQTLDMRGGGTLGATSSMPANIVVTSMAMKAGGTLDATEELTVVPTSMSMRGGGRLRIKMPRNWGENPRTGRPDYRVRIVTRDGAGVTELDEVTITPESEGVNAVDSWSFCVARANAKGKKIRPVEHYAQLWRGDIMVTKGPVGPGRAEGAWMTYDVKDPSSSLREGRFIGRIPRLQLLKNPGFMQGANGPAYWTGTYDADSALKAAPTMRVVEDDYAIPGTRALEMGAVDKVVTMKEDVATSAVFVPNKATYLSGGEAKIKAVGDKIPEGSVVRITGFTADDGTGDGLQLSLERAEAVWTTLDAMGKKFVFKLPDPLRTPNRNDGTVAGRGRYEQIAGGLAANRRVNIAYEGTQTATGHQQYVRQRLKVSNSGKVPMTYTLAGDMRILRWDGAPKDGWAMRLMLLDIVANKEVAETGSVFAPNSATYVSGGEDKIKAIGEKIPEGATINLVGHTADNRRNGDTGNGLDLSVARAEAARKTLDGMGRKFKFALPKRWAEIDPAKRRDNGTVGGRGYFDPVATNATDEGQAKNRRVEVFYTAQTVLAEGEDSSATMNELDPRVEWEHYETSVEVPADAKVRDLEVRLYPPAGASRWVNVGLYPQEVLGFYRVDQALIVKALVEHAQDVTMGHGDLGIKTRTPLTGRVRTKEYAFTGTPDTIGNALDWFTAIHRGMDIDCEVTPTSATVVTHYPRQGSSADIALVHGGRKSNVVAYRPLTSSGRDLASSVMMQADGSGTFRPMVYARDDKALGGALLEALVVAEQETPPSELAEGAKMALDQSLHPRPGWEVTVDPAWTTRVLDEIGKGDLVRLSLPDEGVDKPLRMVQRVLDPNTDTLTLTLVEA